MLTQLKWKSAVSNLIHGHRRTSKPSNRRRVPLFDRFEERQLLTTGAIFTTVADGMIVNANLYAAKDDVYLNGGPQNLNAKGLTDGTYFFQVTSPNGSALLSNDDAILRELQVINGVVAGGFDAGSGQHPNGIYNDLNGSTPVQLAPYDDTPNAGRVYKAWLISTSDATIAPDGKHLIFKQNADVKTDNFRIMTENNNNDAGSVFISTTQDPNVVNLPNAQVLTDTAQLSIDKQGPNGSVPTGKIHFTLYDPSFNIVYSSHVDVNGVNNYSTSDGTPDPGFTGTGYTLPTSGTVTGTYQWLATFESDNQDNYFDVSSNLNDEPVTVNAANPTVVTQASMSVVNGQAVLADSAILSGGYHATGTISFTLTLPDGTTIPVGGTVTVNGDGTYDPTTTYTASQVGNYTWHASYNSDGNNNGAIDNGNNESLTVQGLSKGQTATMGFWNNSNGQGLIKNDVGNGTGSTASQKAASSTQLGNYIAAQMPNFFGGLKGKNNTYVASYMAATFSMSGDVTTKLEAQALSVVLASYFTTPTSSGGGWTSAGAGKYGFVQNGDLLNTFFKVTTNNIASVVPGLTTGGVYTVGYILGQIDALATGGNVSTVTVGSTSVKVLFAGQSTKRGLITDVLNGINQSGDIKSV